MASLSAMWAESSGFLRDVTAILRGFNQLADSIRGVKQATQEERDAAIAASAQKAAILAKEAEARKANEEAAKRMAEFEQRRIDGLKRAAEQMAQSLRTPAEVWKDTMREISDLMNANLIDWDTYTRAIERANDELDKATVKKQELSKPASPIAAVLRGTAAARSAEFAAESSMKEQLNEAKRQTELAKAARDQRNQMLVELRKKGVTVKEVTL
jgi:hypothetical protein